MPPLATYIFLNFQIKPESDAGNDPGKAFSPFPYMRRYSNPQPLDRELSLSLSLLTPRLDLLKNVI